MGADIKTLRIRIKSVDSTLHLTKAMGLVASSKIRGATAAMLRSKDYSAALTAIVDQLSSCAECRKSPFVAGNESDKTKIIVIAGDRGLAGGYNANVFREAAKYPDAEFIPIGKRACELLAPYGRTFGPDPASKNSSMVGGIVMNNASGMSCGVHANSDRVLKSIRIILADGTLLDTADKDSRIAFAGSHAGLIDEIAAIRDEIRADAELTERIEFKYSIKNVTGLTSGRRRDSQHRHA